MGKKSKLFALTLAMSLVVSLTLPLHALAFYTDLWFNDRVEITTIIGFQNQSWHFIIKNINLPDSDPDYDRLGHFDAFFLGINAFDLVSSISSPPGYISVIFYFPSLDISCVAWYGEYPHIIPGTQKKFSFQTNKVTGVAVQSPPFLPPPFCASLGPASLPEGPANATIIEVVGTVEVLPSGTTTWVPATVGMALALGDEVRTADNGYATIQLDEESTLANKSRSTAQLDEVSTSRMEPGSALRFTAIAANTSFLDMIFGKIRYKIIHYSKRFEVRIVPFAMAVRGTEFIVEYSEAGGKQTGSVSVQSGEVEVADLRGGRLGAITIVPGGSTYTTPSGALPFLMPLLMGD